MSRTAVIAGNWKCHLRLQSAHDLAAGLVQRLDGIGHVEKVLCPTFVHLATVAQAIRSSTLKLGAQDVHWEDDVAATGEVGPQMLAQIAEYVIIGHSERRHQFGETDEMVNRKVKGALAAGLKPIMCVGEKLQERETGLTEAVLVRQVRSGLEGTDLPAGFIIAYEPVWAIGTGNAATPADAQAAVAVIRREIEAMFGAATASATRILYGGSVTESNIADFMACDGIDGGLVGGASLKVEAFARIVEVAAQARPA
jgi:triosephosphate isomerase